MRLSLAFAALVAVVPAFVNASSSHTGTAIPIRKHAVPIKDDKDVVNKATLRSLHNGPLRKLRRAFKAYEDNTGKVHSLAIRTSGEVFGRDDGSGADPLINDYNLRWYGTISVGTPPVNFTVDFDTGSGDLFLPGTSCKTTCQGHKIYNTAASSTAKDLGEPFKLGFGDGSLVQGDVFTDTVRIAGLTVTNQHVGAASEYSTNFGIKAFPPDGLMGMAFSEVARFKSKTVFENLIVQGSATVPQFSFKLAANDPELFLGGSNPRLFTGEFTTMDVTEVGFWQVTLDSVSVGGKPAITGVQAVIDTGTSFILGPEQDVVKFYHAIPGSKDATDTVGPGFFTFPCDTDPQVSLTFGGRQLDIPVSSFIIGQVADGSTDCIGGVTSGPGFDFWIVGDVFLRNYYTRFDVEKKQVGFADLA